RDRFTWDPVRLKRLQLEGDADNGFATIQLPFNFALTATSFAAARDTTERPVLSPHTETHFSVGDPIWIDTDGRVRFGSQESRDHSTGAGENSDLPSGYGPMLFPFWDDLVMSGGISYGVVGTTPQRRLVIQWDGAYRAHRADRVLFRAVLFEGTNEVRY